MSTHDFKKTHIIPVYILLVIFTMGFFSPALTICDTTIPPDERSEHGLLPAVRFSFSVVDNHSELLIRSGKPIDRYEIFMIDSPQRLILEIFGVDFPKGFEQIKVGRNDLKLFRVASHENKVRFVFVLPEEKKVVHSLERIPNGFRVVFSCPQDTEKKETVANSEVRTWASGVKKPEPAVRKSERTEPQPEPKTPSVVKEPEPVKTGEDLLPAVRFSFSVVDNHSELLIRSGKPIDRYEIFMIDSPQRLILEIFGVDFPEGFEQIKVGRNDLKLFRVASHENKVRFVFVLPEEKKVVHSIKRIPDGLKLVLLCPQNIEKEATEKNREVEKLEVGIKKQEPEVERPEEIKPRPTSTSPWVIKKSEPVEEIKQPAGEIKEQKKEAGESEGIKPHLPEQPQTAPVLQDQISNKTETITSPQISLISKPANINDIPQKLTRTSDSRKTYKGEKISIKLQQASLNDFFDLISSTSKQHIHVSPEINEKISLNLLDIPWDQALDLVIEFYGLNIEKKDGEIHISAPRQKPPDPTNQNSNF